MPTLIKYRGPWRGQSAKADNLLGPEYAINTDGFVLFDEVLQKFLPYKLIGDNRPFMPYFIGLMPKSPSIFSNGLPFYIDVSSLYSGNTAGVPISWTNRGVVGNGADAGINCVFYQDKMWFCTNSATHGTLSPDQLLSVTPAFAVAVASTFVGGSIIGQLAEHLIVCNCGDAGGSHPNRVAWSASGLPTIWDPAVNVNAGFTDLSQMGPWINGFANIDRYGLVFSAHNIQWMVPTGYGTQPFVFQPLSSSYNQNNIGAKYGKTIDSNGQYCFFMSDYDIHMISINGLSEIGGDARNDIFDDIANAILGNGDTSTYNAVGSTGNNPIGSILPRLDQFNPNPVYLLTIPLGDQFNMSTAMWIYDIQGKRWTRKLITDGWITNKIINIPKLNNSGSYNLTHMLVNSGILPLPNNFIYAQEANLATDVAPISYEFPVNETDGQFLTVTNIRVLYQDIANKNTMTLSFTATYLDESGIVYTTVANVTVNLTGDGLIKQVYVPIEFTGILSHLTLATSDSPYITGVDLIGSGQEIPVI